MLFLYFVCHLITHTLCICLFIYFRFLDKCPDGTVFVVMCFVSRSIEANGCSMLSTASFAIMAKTFPNNVGSAIVSKNTIFTTQSIYYLLYYKCSSRSVKYCVWFLCYSQHTVLDGGMQVFSGIGSRWPPHWRGHLPIVDVLNYMLLVRLWAMLTMISLWQGRGGTAKCEVLCWTDF